MPRLRSWPTAVCASLAAATGLIGDEPASAVVKAGTGYTASQADLLWRIEGTGDLNRDGRSDILWRELNTGETYLWFMDGARLIGAGYTASQADLSWHIQHPK